MKVIIKNTNNLFINNYKRFHLKRNIITNNEKKNKGSYLLIKQCENHLLLFKSNYYNNFTFNYLVINRINFYALLNNNSNCYLVLRSARFEYVYNLTYKIVLNIIVKHRVKITFANKFSVYINLLICLTEKFINKT